MSRTAKTEALASHLLDGFLLLREKYAFLEPMLFDRRVIDVRGSGTSARGFHSLKHTLFLSCAQDIANLALDADRRAPSILNVLAALQDGPIRNELRERFAMWKMPKPASYSDPFIIEALARIEQREEAQRRAQFDELLHELQSSWATLSGSTTIERFRQIRDKVSAHMEIRQVADTYAPIDIATIGLKWGDILQTINPMQRLVELCGLLVRNATFAWDSLESQLAASSAGFWNVGNIG